MVVHPAGKSEDLRVSERTPCQRAIPTCIFLDKISNEENCAPQIATQYECRTLLQWLSLTQVQKRALNIVSARPEISPTEAARESGMPRTTIARALEVLERQHFLRQSLGGPAPLWRFEDPFMRTWFRALADR